MVQRDPLLLPQNQMSSAYQKVRRYFRRLFKFQQMDFQFALWQMFYLLIAPQKLTKVFRARKNFKSQYARDDPAFLILFACALTITSIGFAIVFHSSVFAFFRFLLITIFLDCIGVGLVIATLLWYITNRFMKPKGVPQDVEWGFAFDIHLNAFFPPLIIVHFLLLFFFELVLNRSVVIGNFFWLAAAVYYVYITFLGYHSMQILNKVNLFLIPIPCLIIIYLISVFSFFNISEFVFFMYLGR